MPNQTKIVSILALSALLWRCDPLTQPVRDAEKSLAAYRSELSEFRQTCGGAGKMPDVRFYLFGMGGRPKLLYKNGELQNALTGMVLKKWPVRKDLILPHEYKIVILDSAGAVTLIREDSLGIWLERNGESELLPGTGAAVRLPDFQGKRFANVLKVLHQEILINIVGGRPVPNFFIYPRPWYRDGAMMAMCLKATGNLGLIREWILGLRESFDRNNAGEAEADNPGQALYLISLVSDRNHPLVPELLKALKRFEVRDGDRRFIRGRSDFSEHPVYQTKWAMLGIEALGLPDPYSVPDVEDGYGALFWMGREGGRNAPLSSGDESRYPYLDWASDHFFGTKTGKISDRDYPLTWETEASQAGYEGMGIVDERYTRDRTGTPHTWHAAEAFLSILDSDRNTNQAQVKP
jgi:hypothetical protein